MSETEHRLKTLMMLKTCYQTKHFLHPPSYHRKKLTFFPFSNLSASVPVLMADFPGCILTLGLKFNKYKWKQIPGF